MQWTIYYCEDKSASFAKIDALFVDLVLNPIATKTSSLPLTRAGEVQDQLETVSGEVCDIDIDECATTPCAGGATCEDRLNDVLCVCPPGVTGRYCETPINECESSPCEHGLCIDQINAFK